MIKTSNISHTFSASHLAEFYAISANGDPRDAKLVTSSIQEPYTFAWNTLIRGHLKKKITHKAISLDEQVIRKSVKPDTILLPQSSKHALRWNWEGVTLVSMLTAIAYLGALAQGKWVHAYIRKHGIEVDENLGYALVNMYSKCGCFDGETSAFNKTKRKSLDTWNAMIGGLASNGQCLGAIDLFSRMENSNNKPNAITFSCILNACSLGGLVQDGLTYLRKLITIYVIEPDIAHYRCAIDLLGRAGIFDRLEEIKKSMPMKPDAIMWKSLLGACKIHKNFDLGQKASLKIIKLKKKMQNN